MIWVSASKQDFCENKHLNLISANIGDSTTPSPRFKINLNSWDKVFLVANSREVSSSATWKPKTETWSSTNSSNLLFVSIWKAVSKGGVDWRRWHRWGPNSGCLEGFWWQVFGGWLDGFLLWLRRHLPSLRITLEWNFSIRSPPKKAIFHLPNRLFV